VQPKLSPADLIQEYRKVDAWVTGETARFTDHLAPHKKRCEEIKSILLGMMNEGKINNISTDAGAAYISTIMTPKIVDRDKYLDFVNENWESVGNEMLQVSMPQKTALKTYMEEHNDALPPGVEVSYFNRVNIKA
jgi:hypothetical protein